MAYSNKIATIFGGTGFIGRYIVQHLAKAGYTVKIATRVPERAYFLKTCGAVGQIVPFSCNYNDPGNIANAIQGADIVINCIGILRQKKKGGFDRAHTEIPRAIATACTKQNIDHFIHISALGCDQATSKYAQSKKAGEQAVHKEYPQAVILRPSVVFGPEDNFFNMFAELSRYVPALPLIGGGHTQFQPVYVGDIADAVMAVINRPDSAGHIYELGGPDVMSFRDIYHYLFTITGRRRCLVSLPFGIAKIQAGFMSLLPNPPLTRDQVESLKTDSIVSEKALKLADLGVIPTAIGLIVPEYLEYCRPGGRFGDKKRA